MEFLILIAVLAFVAFIVLSNREKPAARRKQDQNSSPSNQQPTKRRLHAVPERSQETLGDRPGFEILPGGLPSIPESRVIKGKAYVIDGDTIRIKGTKIRLSGIDAPETNMPWGQKSKWAMVGICKGQTITVKLDGERSYDRLVGTCYLPDGRDIGAEIIKAGLALDLPHFSGGKYRHLEPQGARRKLGYGKFGHSTLRSIPPT